MTDESLSIMQDWTMQIGLRHQGVLVSAIRGCHGALRDDQSKWLVRFYRACVLNAHCGDVTKAKSYMVWPDESEQAYFKFVEFKEAGLDHYPMHWLMHFMFAAEIVGYYHPTTWVRTYWNFVYKVLVRKLHLYPESKEQLNARLNKDEASFAEAQV